MKEVRPTSTDSWYIAERLKGFRSLLNTFKKQVKKYSLGKISDDYNIDVEHDAIENELNAIKQLLAQISDEKIKEKYTEKTKELELSLRQLAQEIKSSNIEEITQEDNEALSSIEVVDEDEHNRNDWKLFSFLKRVWLFLSWQDPPERTTPKQEKKRPRPKY